MGIMDDEEQSRIYQAAVQANRELMESQAPQRAAAAMPSWGLQSARGGMVGFEPVGRFSEDQPVVTRGHMVDGVIGVYPYGNEPQRNRSLEEFWEEFRQAHRRPRNAREARLFERLRESMARHGQLSQAEQDLARELLIANETQPPSLRDGMVGLDEIHDRVMGIYQQREVMYWPDEDDEPQRRPVPKAESEDLATPEQLFPALQGLETKTAAELIELIELMARDWMQLNRIHNRRATRNGWCPEYEERQREHNELFKVLLLRGRNPSENAVRYDPSGERNL